jgi:ABC-type bacteriocin/lantibiotic exporter with double-glycine peptidase domain
LPLLFLLGASIPFVKPSIASLNGFEMFDRWEHDVCLQSTASTCGPAAAATILRSFGVNTTEAELASAARTSASGTEVWFLIRELRRRGFTVRPRTGIRTLDQVTPPAIAGVRNASTGTGHFIALVRRESNNLFVGDPLTGGATYAMEDATNLFTFTGFFVEVSRRTR